MAVLKKMIVALVLIVVAPGVVGLLLPRRVHVERSAVIDAPRATVFALVNGYKSFNKWSPWFDKDPSARYSYEGPELGVGANMSWSGDPNTVGSGSREIVESRPFEAVRTRLAGPPITINTRWADGTYEFEAGIPLNRTPDGEVPGHSAVKVKQTYSGRAIKVVHRGAYRDMPSTYAALDAYAAAYGFEAAGPSWDEYVSDPGNTPEAELITNIYMPIK